MQALWIIQVQIMHVAYYKMHVHTIQNNET